MRVAEFDAFFESVRRVERPQPTRLELTVPCHAEATARGLAERESACCSFFTFEFADAGSDLVMRISVPPAHIEVIDALEARIQKIGDVR